MTDLVTLVALPTLRSGDISETETDLFCEIRSVGFRETYAAAAVGIKPEVMVRLADYFDYQGQPFVRLDGVLYKVYRTYRDGIALDLTLASPVGLKDTLEKCYLGKSKTPAWCAVGYVQLAEVDEAGLSGLIHELHLIINAAVYHGEDTVEYAGKAYAIRRTFQEDRDIVDLYIEERAGI